MVDISYRNRKIQKLCASKAEMTRALGPAMAAKLAQRLAELIAVESLADLALDPGRAATSWWPARSRDGQLSLDLVHPRRLIIEPADDPVPVKVDGGLDWSKVTAAVVTEITDPH